MKRQGSSVALLSLFLLFGCSGETALQIEITSELSAPGGIDGLTIRAVGESGARLDRAIALTAPFPHTFTLLPKDSESETVQITVDGTKGGAVMASATRSEAFSAGEVRLVRLVLETACAGVMCEVGEECRGGACVTIMSGDGGMDVNTPDMQSPDVRADVSTDTPPDIPTGFDASFSCDEDVELLPETGGTRTIRLLVDSEAGSCGGAAGVENYYRFVLSEARDVFISTHGSAHDTVLYLRSGGCAGAEVACNDDADTLATSVIQTQLEAGDYVLVVDSKSSEQREVMLHANFTIPGPAGDNCGRPLPFAGGVATGTTCGATSTNSGNCGGQADGLAGPDQVYYFAVERRGAVSFTSCGGCTDFNVSLDLRSVCASVGAGGRVDCGADNCRSTCAGGGRPVQAMTGETLMPGLYYLVVDGRGAACGEYSVSSTGL